MKVGIAAYDIAVSKYRSTLSKLLISYGERVQFSVFEFKLKDKEYKDFILKIKSFYKDYENYLSKNNIKKTFYKLWNIEYIEGWYNFRRTKKVIWNIVKKEVVFLSPIPFILGTLCKYSEKSIYVFCNSKRSKNENGKEIKFTLESEGWQLIKI